MREKYLPQALRELSLQYFRLKLTLSHQLSIDTCQEIPESLGSSEVEKQNFYLIAVLVICLSTP